MMPHCRIRIHFIVVMIEINQADISYLPCTNASLQSFSIRAIAQHGFDAAQALADTCFVFD